MQAHLAWAANDPYVLYSAGNLGSALGLLSYPVILIIKRHFGLQEQSRFWGWGYGILVTLTVGCALSLWFVPRGQSARKQSPGRNGIAAHATSGIEMDGVGFSSFQLDAGSYNRSHHQTATHPAPFNIPACNLPSQLHFCVFARKPVTYHRTFVETLPILLLVMAFPLASKVVLFGFFLRVHLYIPHTFLCLHGLPRRTGDQPPLCRVPDALLPLRFRRRGFRRPLQRNRRTFGFQVCHGTSYRSIPLSAGSLATSALAPAGIR